MKYIWYLDVCIDGLVWDCGDPLGYALELPQSSAEPSVFIWFRQS